MDTSGRKTAADYPQELLDLFHEYQHGDIDRREFFERAKRFAIGGLTVAAIFETLKPNYAWAQQVAKDDKDITTSVETVPSPQGNGSIKGYFAKPAKLTGKAGAILVIHENRGLNPYIEDVARRFAKAGFIAYAPDGLTSVGGFPGTDEEGAVKFRAVDGTKMFEDFVAAYDWLKKRADVNGKVGPSASASAAASSTTSRGSARIWRRVCRSTARRPVRLTSRRSRRLCSFTTARWTRASRAAGPTTTRR